MNDKLNILYVANSRIPTEKAHGKQIVETCQALADQDCSVLLLLPARVNCLKNDLFDFYRVRRNFTVKKLPCLDLLWLPFGKGFFFFVQSATFALSAIVFYFFHKSIFDAVYTRDFIAATIFPAFAKKFFFEIHTIPDKVRFYHRIIWQRQTGLVVISDVLKNELIRYGVPETKILVARDGVNLADFDVQISREEARRKLGLDSHKKIVVYTGHLYDWKGADLLAEASVSLPPDVQVHIVGGTTEDVYSFKKRFNYPNLFIVGHRPPQEIPIWLKAADLLVLPNKADKKISSHYTSPLKLFEYMASGIPMIVSNLPSLREVLSEDEAFFFDPYEANLTAAIKTALSNPAHLRDKASLAKKKVVDYTWRTRGLNIKFFLQQHLYAN